MIVHDVREQAIECAICGGQEGVDERSLRNQAALTIRMGQMAEDHRACEKWAGQPARAKAERAYTIRMRQFFPQDV